MKIGILTYHRSHNYGALLQAFALKFWLQNQNYSVEVVDYWPSYHSDEYRLLHRFKSKSIISKIKAIVYLISGYRKFVKRINGYEKFIIQYLDLPKKPKYVKINDLELLEYDLVIYGSDQIWRKQNHPFFTGFDETYFGSYINAQKKISYAASMGVISIQCQSDRSFLTKHLKQFNHISVREIDLQQVVHKITGSKPDLVLDPVFLLNKKQWIDIMPKSKKRDKYILLYQLKRYNNSVLLTNMLKQHLGFEVVEILGRVNPLKIGSRYNQTACPLEFISLIYNAEYIISTSFHGVALSILFEKQFYALGMKNNAGRVLSLLKHLKIQDRYIDNINNIDINNMVDYKIVNQLLINQVNNSISFLRSAINE